MPTSRTTRENELAERIAALLLLLRRDVERGQANYSEFAEGLAVEVRDGLRPVFVDAANALAVAELGRELTEEPTAADAWAAAAALVIAREFAANTINGVAEAAVKQASHAHLFARERALALAVTEITRTISAGESFAARSIVLLTGRVATWTWAKEDSEACPFCSDLDGQVNPPIEPPAHPHCRCRKVYSFSVLPVGV